MNACVTPISCQLTQSYAPTAKTHGSFIKMSPLLSYNWHRPRLNQRCGKTLDLKYFAMQKKGKERCKRKLNVICRHSFSELRYTGSTTNMSFHVQRHHPSSASTKACSSTTASSPSQSKAGSSKSS